MMNDAVIVKSKTLNREAITVVFNHADVLDGGVIDTREITRSVVFNGFQAVVPLKIARILVKENPLEFAIVDSPDDNPSPDVKHAVEKGKEAEGGFMCPVCKQVLKSKSGYLGHIRFAHPEQYEDLKKSRV